MFGDFDLVVSLGGYCQTAKQVRRITGQPGLMFDNLVSPFWGVKALIEEDAASLCKSFLVSEDGRNIRCEHYGFVFEHEVDRVFDKIRLNLGELSRIETKFRLKWEHLKREVQHANRILFVRLGGFVDHGKAWPYEPEEKPFGSGELWRMTQAIEQRWPGLDYHLAFIRFPELGVWNFEDEVEHTSVHDFSLDKVRETLPLDAQWCGYDGDWDALFEHFGIMKQEEPA